MPVLAFLLSIFYISLKGSSITLTLPAIIYFLYPLTQMWAPWKKKFCLFTTESWVLSILPGTKYAFSKDRWMKWMNLCWQCKFCGSCLYCSSIFHFHIQHSNSWKHYIHQLLKCAVIFQIFDIRKYWASFEFIALLQQKLLVCVYVYAFFRHKIPRKDFLLVCCWP